MSHREQIIVKMDLSAAESTVVGVDTWQIAERMNELICCSPRSQVLLGLALGKFLISCLSFEYKVTEDRVHTC